MKYNTEEYDEVMRKAIATDGKTPLPKEISSEPEVNIIEKKNEKKQLLQIKKKFHRFTIEIPNKNLRKSLFNADKIIYEEQKKKLALSYFLKSFLRSCCLQKHTYFCDINKNGLF